MTDSDLAMAIMTPGLIRDLEGLDQCSGLDERQWTG